MCSFVSTIIPFLSQVTAFVIIEILIFAFVPVCAVAKLINSKSNKNNLQPSFLGAHKLTSKRVQLPYADDEIKYFK